LGNGYLVQFPLKLFLPALFAASLKISSILIAIKKETWQVFIAVRMSLVTLAEFELHFFVLL